MPKRISGSGDNPVVAYDDIPNNEKKIDGAPVRADSDSFAIPNPQGPTATPTHSTEPPPFWRTHRNRSSSPRPQQIHLTRRVPFDHFELIIKVSARTSNGSIVEASATVEIIQSGRLTRHNHLTSTHMTRHGTSKKIEGGIAHFSINVSYLTSALDPHHLLGTSYRQEEVTFKLELSPEKPRILVQRPASTQALPQTIPTLFSSVLSDMPPILREVIIQVPKKVPKPKPRAIPTPPPVPPPVEIQKIIAKKPITPPEIIVPEPIVAATSETIEPEIPFVFSTWITGELELAIQGTKRGNEFNAKNLQIQGTYLGEKMPIASHHQTEDSNLVISFSFSVLGQTRKIRINLELKNGIFEITEKEKGRIARSIDLTLRNAMNRYHQDVMSVVESNESTQNNLADFYENEFLPLKAKLQKQRTTLLAIQETKEIPALTKELERIMLNLDLIGENIRKTIDDLQALLEPIWQACDDFDRTWENLFAHFGAHREWIAAFDQFLAKKNEQWNLAELARQEVAGSLTEIERKISGLEESLLMRDAGSDDIQWSEHQALEEKKWKLKNEIEKIDNYLTLLGEKEKAARTHRAHLENHLHEIQKTVREKQRVISEHLLQQNSYLETVKAEIADIQEKIKKIENNFDQAFDQACTTLEEYVKSKILQSNPKPAKKAAPFPFHVSLPYRLLETSETQDGNFCFKFKTKAGEIHVIASHFKGPNGRIYESYELEIITTIHSGKTSKMVGKARALFHCGTQLTYFIVVPPPSDKTNKTTANRRFFIMGGPDITEAKEMREILEPEKIPDNIRFFNFFMPSSNNVFESWLNLGERIESASRSAPFENGAPKQVMLILPNGDYHGLVTHSHPGPMPITYYHDPETNRWFQFAYFHGQPGMHELREEQVPGLVYWSHVTQKNLAQAFVMDPNASTPEKRVYRRGQRSTLMAQTKEDLLKRDPTSALSHLALRSATEMISQHSIEDDKEISVFRIRAESLGLVIHVPIDTNREHVFVEGFSPEDKPYLMLKVPKNEIGYEWKSYVPLNLYHAEHNSSDETHGFREIWSFRNQDQKQLIRIHVKPKATQKIPASYNDIQIQGYLCTMDENGFASNEEIPLIDYLVYGGRGLLFTTPDESLHFWLENDLGRDVIFEFDGSWKPAAELVFKEPRNQAMALFRKIQMVKNLRHRYGIDATSSHFSAAASTQTKITPPPSVLPENDLDPSRIRDLTDFEANMASTDIDRAYEPNNILPFKLGWSYPVEESAALKRAPQINLKESTIHSVLSHDLSDITQNAEPKEALANVIPLPWVSLPTLPMALPFQGAMTFVYI